MIFTKDEYQKLIAHYFVRDGSLGPLGGGITLLLVEEVDTDRNMDEGWKSRVLTINLGKPREGQGRFFAASANKLSFASLACSLHSSGQPEAVVVDTTRLVWSQRSKEDKGYEEEIPFPSAGKLKPDAFSEFDSALLKTVRVGATVFAVGTPFRIFERQPGQQWLEHKDIPIPPTIGSADRETAMHAILNTKFHDLAGTSPSDMYAVGSEGTVWQRVKGAWRNVAIPTNVDLFTVAVAADGTAYITDRHCSVWMGRDDHWERVAEGHSSLGYQDSAWFAGRLWCTNDSAGPFVLEGKKMVPAHRAKKEPMPAQVARFAHRIDVSPDGQTMLVAGMQGAATYDGKTWTVLFDGEPDA